MYVVLIPGRMQFSLVTALGSAKLRLSGIISQLRGRGAFSFFNLIMARQKDASN